MDSPRCSKSSPVLATISSSSGGRTRLSPSASLAPPTPPDSATDAHRNRSSSARADQLGCRCSAPSTQAAHQHDRVRLVGLALQQRSGGGDLVGEADDADLQRAAEQVGLAAQVDQLGRPAAPIAMPQVPRRQARPKLSLMTTPIVAPKRCAKPRAQRFRRCVGIARQQQHAMHAVRRGDVGLVDAGVGHHEAEPVLHDDQVRPRAHDARRFATG